MEFVVWVVTCNGKVQRGVRSLPAQATQQPQHWVPLHTCESDELLVC